MKFFDRQRLEKKPVQVEPMPHKEPEGHVHSNYRHWIYLRKSSDR